MKTPTLALIIATLLTSFFARADAVPDCAGPDRWPAKMAFARLKNSGVTDNNKVDFSKTKVVRLASQNVGKGLFRQVHDIAFTEKSGNVIEVITVSDASADECSMSDVHVFLVSKWLPGAEP